MRTTCRDERLVVGSGGLGRRTGAGPAGSDGRIPPAAGDDDGVQCRKIAVAITAWAWSGWYLGERS